MNVEEMKSFVESNKDNEDVKNFIGSLITKENVMSYLKTEEGQKILEKEKEEHFKNSLETWQKDNLPNIINDEISKRYPEETEEQKRLKQLETELSNEKNARVRTELKNKAISLLTTKGLPLDLVDYFIGEDETKTTENLQKLESVWGVSLQKAVEGKFREGGRAPEGSGDTSTTDNDLEKLSMEDYIKARRA